MQGIREHILSLKAEAERYNQRRMIVFADVYEDAIEKVIDALHLLGKKKAVIATPYPEDLLEFKLPEWIEICAYKDKQKLLGATYDLLILDHYKSLEPVDDGALTGIVRGGGLLFMICPPLDEWINAVNKYHLRLLTPPYTPKDVRNNFIKWYIEKLKTSPGIAIFDRGKLIKDGSCIPQNFKESEKFEIPAEGEFDKELYNICKTKDQLEVVRVIEAMMKSPYLKCAFVLTANRGRGKSSGIGIALAGCIQRDLLTEKEIIVTSPEPSNVYELFKFIKIGLEKLGVKIKEYEEGKILETDTYKVRYLTPLDATRAETELIVCDEAAAIPAPTLFQILQQGDKLIYSSTIHGYEGAGRSFSIRFLKRLEKLEDVCVTKYEMKEPIRYSENDPIEDWLFKTLILDAEPAPLKEIKLKETNYLKCEIEDFIKDERKLREFFGILIMAHYKNNPNDFLLLCDIPNQRVRALEYDGHIVCSLQFALEGNLPQNVIDTAYAGFNITGNIIPDRLIKHFREKRFGKLKGIRIVRIATHPSFMDRGIGTKLLKELESEFKDEIDWLGAVFGATPQLLNFWLKNGFKPMHISPQRNPVSAEYSLLVVKPISQRMHELMYQYADDFIDRVIYAVSDPLRDLEPSVLRLCLLSWRKDCTLDLTVTQWRRAIDYAYGIATYELTRDAIYKLVYAYFAEKTFDTAFLEPIDEELLIAKVLEGRSWEETSAIVQKPVGWCTRRMRDLLKELIKEYGDWSDEVFELRKEIQGKLD